MSRYHYLLLVVLVVVSVCGIFTAYRYGIASVNFYNVKNSVEKWHSNPQDIDLQQYLEAKSSSILANEYHPDNAFYLDLMAQVYEWGVIFEFESSVEGLNLAKQYYLRATQLRPLWPVTWASLAKVKWRLQEFDEEMLFFLEQANKLGPKKSEVNLLFTDLGIALYKSNHVMLLKIRPMFYQRLAQGLKNHLSRHAVKQIILKYQAENLVCRWLRDDKNATKWLDSKCR